MGMTVGAVFTTIGLKILLYRVVHCGGERVKNENNR
jgi:hypothetical protein